MNAKYTIFLVGMLTGLLCRGATNASFDEMPAEMIANVAGFLDQSSLKRFAQVSKNCQEVAMIVLLDQLLKTHKDDLQAAFFDAVKNNKLWAINYLVQRGVDINAIDIHAINRYERKTMLMISAENGFESIVKQLIQNKAEVNVDTEWGLTPLMYAIIGKHERVVDQLLLAKANVNEVAKEGETPLRLAAQAHDGVIIKKLIEFGATSNEILKQAIDCQNKEVTRLLVENKADISNISPAQEAKLRKWVKKVDLSSCI